MKCPNCTMTFTALRPHPENGCVLAAVAQVARDRGNKKVSRLHASATNKGAFWEDMGRIVDRFEDGEYGGL